PGRKQVRVQFACTAKSASPEDVVAMELLATDIERQWNALERDALGTSYGFTSSGMVNRDGSMRLEVKGSVDRSSVPQMPSAVAQTWRTLPQTGVPPSRLSFLRWDFARRFDVAFLTGPAVSQAVAEERIRGAARNSLDEYPAVLMRLTQPKLADVGT